MTSTAAAGVALRWDGDAALGTDGRGRVGIGEGNGAAEGPLCGASVLPWRD